MNIKPDCTRKSNSVIMGRKRLARGHTTSHGLCVFLGAGPPGANIRAHDMGSNI